MFSTTERIELIEEAMEQVQEAQDKVRTALGGTEHEAHFDAYGEYGFKQLLSEGNPYDSGLQTLVDDLKEEEE